MKKTTKFLSILCVTGALSLSIGFMNNKDLTNDEALAPIVTTPKSAYTPIVDKGDVTTVITPAEQKMVETMPTLEGFMPQENGTGFSFKIVQNEKRMVEQEVLMVEVTKLASLHLKELGYTNGDIESITGKGNNWSVEFEDNVAINVTMEIDKISGDILNVNVEKV